MIRAVLDTNIIVSAAIADGTPAALMRAARRGAYELVSSAYILEEARRVLVGKLGFTAGDVDPVLLAVAATASDLVPVTRATREWCGDPGDDAVIETALVGRAGFLVTGDRLLLATNVEGTRRITAVEFAALLDA